MSEIFDFKTKTVGDKYIVSYRKKIGNVIYTSKLILNADGDGREDVKQKLIALLKIELNKYFDENFK